MTRWGRRAFLVTLIVLVAVLALLVVSVLHDCAC